MWTVGLNLIVFVVLGHVLASPTGASVHVLKPKSLSDQFPDQLRARAALFGVPPYESSITAPLVYGTSTNKHGCHAYNRTELESIPEPWIMVIDRGSDEPGFVCHNINPDDAHACLFYDKVKNAQTAGAKAAIVVDCAQSYYLPYMAPLADDNSVTIPSVVIFRSDGEKVKEELRQDNDVLVTMSWGLPHPDNRVEWELFTSSNDEHSVTFKHDLEEVSEAMANHALFTPRYRFERSRSCIPRRTDNNAVCDRADVGVDPLCVLSCADECGGFGRYCSVHPQFDSGVGVPGRAVVEENLNQMCLFRVGNSTGNSLLWWNYVNRFTTSCATSSTTWTTDCAHSAMRAVGGQAVVDGVLACRAQYPSLDEDKPHALLEEEMMRAVELGVFFTPYLFVNEQRYEGSLTCSPPIDRSTCGVLSALCAGFAAGTAPQACNSSPGCHMGAPRDECGMCGGDGEMDQCGLCVSPSSPNFDVCLDCAGVPWGAGRSDPATGNCYPDGVLPVEKSGTSGGVVAVIVILVIVVVFVLVAGALYLKKRNQEQEARIDSILSQYAPMTDDRFGQTDVESEPAPLVSPAL